MVDLAPAAPLRHRPSHWFRASVQTALGTVNSINVRIERGIYARRIEATQVQAPPLILGHYRSGTTHLHTRLGLDPEFATPTVLQVLNPHTFLTTERFAAPIADGLMSAVASRTRWP